MHHPTVRSMAISTMGLCLLLPGVAQSAEVTFTGTVPDDFVSPSAITIPDPGGIDVGIPLSFPVGTISGNDMEFVSVDHDPVTDTLYIGVATYGIAGDVDGDGDPSSAGAAQAALGGTDQPVNSDPNGGCVHNNQHYSGYADDMCGHAKQACRPI